MKVAIAGYGIEGQANYTYWTSLGAEVTIFDENSVPSQPLPQGVHTVLGPGSFAQMDGFDLVIRTASLRPDKIKTDGKIWSATNEFFTKCPAPIIGVTGTKGKGTTASLITEILKAAGKTVHLLGNIGVPALEVLPEITPTDFVVFELSSFQLWDLEKSPETAVVLMIEPDHLDVHSSMEEYVGAKANICSHQAEPDLVVYHPTNQFSAQIAATSPAKKQRYMTSEGAEIKDEDIVIAGEIICKTNEVGLIGPHNLENICAAITAAWNYTQDTTAIQKAVIDFKGLPHRLELVGTVDGVSYYDDSQATGVGSCLAALRSFTQPTVLILGGSDKSVDMQPVIDALNAEQHFVVLIGQTSGLLEQKLQKRSFTNFVNLGSTVTMSEIVETARAHAVAGGIVLLSPAHASFGMFKNYQDRGDQFKQAVANLPE